MHAAGHASEATATATRYQPRRSAGDGTAAGAGRRASGRASNERRRSEFVTTATDDSAIAAGRERRAQA